MVRKRWRRGIFLISVLFLVLLVTMFVGAAFELTPWAFRRAGSQADLAAAQRAARCGVEYALARLKLQNSWSGGTTRAVVVDTPELVVVEEAGNVIGLIRSNGQTSQFRIRFNWQDGGPTRDNLNDAPAAMQIQVPLVSCNNFLSGVQREVPKADGSGYSVPATPTTHTTVPPYGLYLVCEGRTGDWLNAADATNPNPTQPTFSPVTSSRAETIFKVTNIGQAVTPAVAATAGTLKVTLPPSGSGTDLNVQLDSADTGVIGRLRSRSDIQFAGGDTFNLQAAPGKQGELRALTNVTTGVSRAAAVLQEDEDSSDLYKIAWSQVKVAGPTNTLQAGVYTVWQDGTLHYYDMTQAQYNAFMAIPANQSDAGSTVTLPSTVTADFSGWPAQAKLRITGDTLVIPGTAGSDLVIIPKKGADGGAGAPGSYDPTELGNGLVQSGFWQSGEGEFDYQSQPNVGRLIHKVAVANSGGTDWSLGGGLYVDDADVDDPELIHSSNNQTATSIAVRNHFVPHLLTYLNSGVTLDAQDLSALGALGVTGGGGVQELPVPDTTAPQNLVVSFEPTSTSAVLSGPGNITLGARVEGEGGSITAEGNISMVGLGVDLAAATNPNEGVSLYSKKDILISTFDKATNSYHDVGLKGVVYCWGNLTALLGATGTATADWGKFQLTGALVAYGKDPDLLTPATAGKVDITAERANLKFDSSYLLSVMGSLPPGAQLGRVWWLQQ